MFRWLRLFTKLVDLDYRIRRLERKFYWKEKYNGSKEKRIKD